MIENHRDMKLKIFGWLRPIRENKGRTHFVIIALAVSMLTLVTAGKTWAFCCGFGSSPACANCNFFGCNCDNPCSCETPAVCKDECGHEENQCIIYCYQANCQYCSGWAATCRYNCDHPNLKSLFSKRPESKSKYANLSTCTQIFGAMDADRNGALSKKEFVEFIETQRKQPLPADGNFSPLQKAISSIMGQNLEELFNKYDTDRNGSISKEEAGIP